MWQPVLMIGGYVVCILGALMLIPAGFDATDSLFANNWSPFVKSSVISIFFGCSLFLSNYKKIEKITIKQAYLVTIISWLMICLFASLPLIFYDAVPNITDALFESFSGVTGTGASVISDVEALPKSILLWRSLLNGLGALGVVIFAVALLPFLGIGGMQMFQKENSDSNDKIMPRFSYIAKRIILVYFLLVAIATVILFFCGMTWFDAVNHAISAIGTGGFSTKNNSIAFYNSSLIEFFVMVFMIMGAIPMTFYILLWKKNVKDKNNQIKIFLKLVFVLSMLLGVYLYVHSDYSFLTAIRYTFFSVISFITTTGLSSCNFINWGIWTTIVFVFISFIGGCTGSTCGSIKIFRWQVVLAFFKKYFLSAIEPSRVVPLKVGEVSTDEKVSLSVFVYVLSFILCLMFLTIVVSFCGVDFSTAFASVVACITNTGVGSVEVIGPAGNYSFFPPIVKWVLCLAMFLGRLEVITVLVLLTKSFWRR